jgi:H/ACA ribonucleoprotein complex subunit 3
MIKMAKHIFICQKCKEYTMQKICPRCNLDSFPPQPAKYSPDDKYAELKRKAKSEDYKEKGLIQ